jgi:protein SCO1
MSKNKSKNIIFILAAIVAMVVGIWAGSYKDQSHGAYKAEKIQGVILPRAKTIHSFNLTDHNKIAFTLENLKGHWSVLFVGYTQCPDVCPAAMSVLKQTHHLMIKQSLIPPEMVFISVDPERDTHKSLAEYVTYFNKKFVGVTGEQNQLKKLTQQLSVSFAKAPGSSGVMDENYLMDHSTSFMLINPDGKLQSFLTAPHLPMQLVDSIKKSQDFYNKTK